MGLGGGCGELWWMVDPLLAETNSYRKQGDFISSASLLYYSLLIEAVTIFYFFVNRQLSTVNRQPPTAHRQLWDCPLRFLCAGSAIHPSGILGVRPISMCQARQST
jgi:hypothetical protein